MKFLLVDDDEIFLRGLTETLNDSNKAIESLRANDCDTALQILAKHDDIKLIILDRKLPGMSGLEGLKLFRQKFPDVPVVMLSGFVGQDGVMEALDNGAAGYIEKGVKISKIMAFIELALQGGTVLPSALFASAGRNQVNENDWMPSRLPADFHLAPREAEVLAWLCKGVIADKRIAAKMGISEGVVGTYLQSIYRKLGVKKRVELIIQVFQWGIDLRGLARESNTHTPLEV
jgi:two-component system, NarL family, nitrate/nitrite response regulator NarL